MVNNDAYLRHVAESISAMTGKERSGRGREHMHSGGKAARVQIFSIQSPAASSKQLIFCHLFYFSKSIQHVRALASDSLASTVIFYGRAIFPRKTTQF
jgi:hypothetical protein